MSEVEAGVEGRAWTRREVELVVNVYLHMLRMQLMGQTPNKAEHNRQLQTMLPARSKASIEYKHCNISAVLVESDVPPLAGCRPSFNYQQQLLVPVVSQAIGRDALWTKPCFVRSRHLPTCRCWIRCAARRPKAFNAVALNGGARIDNIRKARPRVSATVYTSPDASRCAFSSTTVVSLQ
jgi:hypothetical protein